jgi:integrase
VLLAEAVSGHDPRRIFGEVYERQATDSDRNEIRYLTLPQIDRLIANVRPGEFAHLDRAIFITAVMTGLRKGELVALRWRDVDWTRAASACGATTPAASSARPSRGAQAAPYR